MEAVIIMSAIQGYAVVVTANAGIILFKIFLVAMDPTYMFKQTQAWS